MRSVVIAALAATALVAVCLLGYAGLKVRSYTDRLLADAVRKTATVTQRSTFERLDKVAEITPGAERIVAEQGGLAAGRLHLEPDAMQHVGKYNNWMTGPRADRHEKVNLLFFLRRSEEVRAKLERTLYDVSTPGHPRYGQHLTREEVLAEHPPVPGSQEAVRQWLGAHGVKAEDSVPDGSIMEATMSVEVAETMLHTTLRRFTHRRSGVTQIRAASAYSVPSEVAFALYIVGNLVHLPALDEPPTVKKEVPQTTVEEGPAWPNDCERCSGFTTPGVLRLAYNVPAPEKDVNTTMAIAQFQGVSYRNEDLYDFDNKCRLGLGGDIAPHKTDGFNNPGYCSNFFTADICLESLLDIQYSKAMIGDAKLWVLSDTDYSLENWAKKVIAYDDDERPPIHSVSYGNDEVQQDSPEYMDAVNDQFKILGSIGVSILFASGDMGVYGRTGVEEDGRFHPDFPGASPYITSIGGTNFVQQSVIGEESAWSASGGGFSDHSPTPDYQKAAVEAYLKKASQTNFYPDESHFNKTGRGYPDVSALGGMTNPYCVDTAGLFGGHIMVGVGGTSASCPVVSGIFARLNAERANAGLTPMGFLNPWIYQNPGVFNDVKQGDNRWKGSEGFSALEGWDASTGFGTPNFVKMKEAALAGAAPAPGPEPTFAPIAAMAETMV